MRNRRITYGAAGLVTRPYFRDLITNSPEFNFNISDIGRVRDELKHLITNLSSKYFETKAKENEVMQERDQEEEKEEEEQVIRVEGRVSIGKAVFTIDCELVLSVENKPHCLLIKYKRVDNVDAPEICHKITEEDIVEMKLFEHRLPTPKGETKKYLTLRAQVNEENGLQEYYDSVTYSPAPNFYTGGTTGEGLGCSNYITFEIGIGKDDNVAGLENALKYANFGATNHDGARLGDGVMDDLDAEFATMLQEWGQQVISDRYEVPSRSAGQEPRYVRLRELYSFRPTPENPIRKSADFTCLSFRIVYRDSVQAWRSAIDIAQTLHRKKKKGKRVIDKAKQKIIALAPWSFKSSILCEHNLVPLQKNDIDRLVLGALCGTIKNDVLYNKELLRQVEIMTSDDYHFFIKTLKELRSIVLSEKTPETSGDAEDDLSMPVLESYHPEFKFGVDKAHRTLPSPALNTVDAPTVWVLPSPESCQCTACLDDFVASALALRSYDHRDPDAHSVDSDDSDMYTDDDDDSVKGGPDEEFVTITGAGLANVNGIYKETALICDGLPVYEMQGTWRGRACRYCLFRCKLSNGNPSWYISYVPQGIKPGTTKDVDFYTADPVGNSDLPPESGWRHCSEGADPPPTVRHNDAPLQKYVGAFQLHNDAAEEAPIEMSGKQVPKVSVGNKVYSTGCNVAFLPGVGFPTITVSYEQDNEQVKHVIFANSVVDLYMTPAKLPPAPGNVPTTRYYVVMNVHVDGENRLPSVYDEESSLESFVSVEDDKIVVIEIDQKSDYKRLFRALSSDSGFRNVAHEGLKPFGGSDLNPQQRMKAITRDLAPMARDNQRKRK